MLDNQIKLIWLAALAVLGALLFIFYELTSASGEPNQKTGQERATFTGVFKDTNKEMIDGGFLAAGDVYPLTNMTEAIALQDKYADYLESLRVGIEGGGLTKDDIDKYRRSYRVILPSLWKEELVAIKSISKNSSIFEKIYFTYRQKTAHQKASSELSLSQIREIFIKTAEAAYSINPCYREGAPNL